MRIIKNKLILVIFSFLCASYMQAQLYQESNKSNIKPLTTLALESLVNSFISKVENLETQPKLTDILDIENVPAILSTFAIIDSDQINIAILLAALIDNLDKQKELPDISLLRLKLEVFLSRLTKSPGFNPGLTLDTDKIISTVLNILNKKIERTKKLLSLLIENIHFESANKNDIQKVKNLIDKGVYINTPNRPMRDTALILASKSGNIDWVKLIIKAGADINRLNKMDKTALMHAAIHSHKKIVKLLINAGANINIQDKYQNSPLINAINFSNNVLSQIEIVRLLIAAGADVNIQNYYGKTALIKASSVGNIEIVKLLIKAGADINIKDNQGDTAISLAKNDEIKELLIKATTNINRDNEIESPLVDTSAYDYRYTNCVIS